jgi:transposase
MRSDLATIKNPDQVVTDLQVLTSRRQDLMADWVRGVNRIRDLLTSVFPGLEQAFDYSTRSALILLTGFQAPAQIRAAGAFGVAAWLREQGAWPRAIDAMAGKAAAAANAQTIALPAEAAAAPLIAVQASHLLDLDRQIKDLDKQITARVSDHPGARPITSVAGFGPLLAAQLLASTSGDLAATFGNPGRLAAYAGLVPVPKDSGRVHGNLRRPTRYHRVLRRVFYQAALSAIKPDGPSRAYYQRKRAEGKLHTQVLLALARRLVDVIWALLRDGREFSCTAPA